MSSKNNKFSKILSKNYYPSANTLFFRGSLEVFEGGGGLSEANDAGAPESGERPVLNPWLDYAEPPRLVQAQDPKVGARVVGIDRMDRAKRKAATAEALDTVRINEALSQLPTTAETAARIAAETREYVGAVERGDTVLVGALRGHLANSDNERHVDVSETPDGVQTVRDIGLGNDRHDIQYQAASAGDVGEVQLAIKKERALYASAYSKFLDNVGMSIVERVSSTKPLPTVAFVEGKDREVEMF